MAYNPNEPRDPEGRWTSFDAGDAIREAAGVKKNIAYHKQFGEIEILSRDENFTTILVLKTGETKKLATKYADILISDKPFVKEKKAAHKSLLTEQEKEDLKKLDGSILRKAFEESTARSRAGEAGLISLIK